MLNQNGWLAVLVTNQAGVARGYFAEDVIHEVHGQLELELSKSGAKLDAIYYCPHHPAIGSAPYRLDCNCRKPKPGLLAQATKDLDIDVQRSWMVGDRYSDVELAHNAHVHSALVLTGYGRGEWEYQRLNWKLNPELVAENLLEAVQLIITGDHDPRQAAHEESHA
jgi:D-glycero-D-manno-heptose 1,7-bisphosphate phosphatase